MIALKTKISAVQQYISDNSLRDPRLLGLILLAVIGLSVLWSGVGVVHQNYRLAQRTALLEEENAILELENSNKSIQNEYLKTPEFAELKARRVNGRALPGETVYIIDDAWATSNLKTPESQSVDDEATQPKPHYQQNFEAWINFFFGT